MKTTTIKKKATSLKKAPEKSSTTTSLIKDFGHLGESLKKWDWLILLILKLFILLIFGN
jgi:hypothetical protein